MTVVHSGKLKYHGNLPWYHSNILWYLDPRKFSYYGKLLQYFYDIGARMVSIMQLIPGPNVIKLFCP
jgi:hypothetical protein